MSGIIKRNQRHNMVSAFSTTNFDDQVAPISAMERDKCQNNRLRQAREVTKKAQSLRNFQAHEKDNSKDNAYTDKQIIAVQKIIAFLKACRAVRQAYEQRFQEILLSSVTKIQRASRQIQLRRQFTKHGILHATIFLDARDLNLGQIGQVHIFGEFSERPWQEKIECKGRSIGSTTLYSVDIRIKIGQKFKFIIDNGRAYATSSHYLQTSDEAGNTNNIFQFNWRSQEERLLER